MKRKIIGITVGTPLSPQKTKEKLNPVTSVNGIEPDENGNVEVEITDLTEQVARVEEAAIAAETAKADARNAAIDAETAAAEAIAANTSVNSSVSLAEGYSDSAKTDAERASTSATIAEEAATRAEEAATRAEEAAANSPESGGGGTIPEQCDTILFVDITKDENGKYVSSHSFGEIKAHLENGGFAVGRYNGRDLFVYEVTENYVRFVYHSAGGSYSDTYDISADGTVLSLRAHHGHSTNYISATAQQSLSYAQQTQARENIGALSEEDLTEAVNAALAQAKESGEFNGADGKDGETPTVKISNAVKTVVVAGTSKKVHGLTIEGPTIIIDEEAGIVQVNEASVWDGADGADGKSAYAYAREAGYTGTEAEFAQKLASDSSGGVDFTTDANLKLENGVLSVNTTDQVEQDNTLPITSAGVFATVGNIEALLKTI